VLGTVDSTSPGRKADYVLTYISSPAAGTQGSTTSGSVMQERMTVYVWRDLRGVLAAYRLKNTGPTAITGQTSLELYPRIDQSYTAHSLRWRSQDSIALYFRTGLTHYLGAKYLSGSLSGVRLMTGTTFFVNGTIAETQPDSVRYRGATFTGFDASVDSAGTPRSMINLNANTITIGANDSSGICYYAMAYHPTEAGIVTAISAVRTRYVQRFLTSVEPVSPVVPEAFALDQNYPNPFNPNTKIGFKVAGSVFVSLKVYDVLGREVATLVNEQLTPGTYSATHSAENLPSGVYFYRLTSGSFTETKRMLLLK